MVKLREEISRVAPSSDGRVIIEADISSVPQDVWDRKVERARRVGRVFDRHLDYESIYQGHDLTPELLCPEQRVNAVSDIMAELIGGQPCA